MTSPHAAEQPVVIVHETGFRTESWHRPDGKPHRVDGPAITHYGPDGFVTAEEYRLDGLISRLDGPARVHYRKGSTQVDGEEWWVGSWTHRLDGPAAIDYDADGSVRVSRWSVLGDLFSSRSEALLSLAGRTPEVIATAVESSVYRVLLDEGAEAVAIVNALRDDVRTVDGLRALLLDGAPIEWVRSFEEPTVDRSLDDRGTTNPFAASRVIAVSKKRTKP